MIKKIIVTILVFLSAIATAQDGTSSPYSFYGLGETKNDNSIENRSMGSVNVFKDSIRINFNNPASYSHLKFTTFAFAGTQNFNELNTSNKKSEARRTTLDYLAVTIPLGKSAVAFGLRSAYSTGYKLENLNITQDASDSFTRSEYFVGSGSVNKFFVGGGYEINKNLSAGVEFNYYFGKKDYDFYQIINQVTYLPGTLETNNSNITGYNFNFGLMYNKRLTKDIELFSGLTYAPKGKITIDNNRKISGIAFTEVDIYGIVDEISETITNTTYDLPSKYSFSLGIADTKKWGIGVEYSGTETSLYKQLHLNETKIKFEDASRISIGGFYVPKYNSFTNYFSRITYRAGFRYEKTGIILENTSINDSGITFGLGLPIAGIFSSANLGLEYGNRGTTNSGLVQEKYFNVSLSLSLSDKWFIKRKYN